MFNGPLILLLVAFLTLSTLEPIYGTTDEGGIDEYSTNGNSSNDRLTNNTKSNDVSRNLEQSNFLPGRIVNGTKAILRQFPHQVSLRRSWSGSHFCGAVIASESIVLTAAHCMFLNDVIIQAWTIIVVAGELQLNKATSTGQRRGVQEIVIHPLFDHDTLTNDISILKLKANFEFTPEIKPAKLPVSTYLPGTICQVSGWGYPASDIGMLNNDLMYVNLPIMPPKLCRELLVGVTDLPPGMFCAGYLEGGKDACGGDSGGGMVCNGVLTGIVSGGEGCAMPRLPGLYTDVYFYKQWVNNTSFLRIPSEGFKRYSDSYTNGLQSITSTFLSVSFLYLFTLYLE